MDTLLLLLPDLALIATGVVLYRATAWGDAFWAGLEKLVYNLLFPALLFMSIVRNRIAPEEAAPFAGAILAVLAIGIVLGRLGRRLHEVEPRRFASAVQCAFRFNSYVALALSQRLGGEAGVALCAVVVAVAVPVGNAAAVWHLARHSGAGLGRELARNPLIIATVAGLAANLAGITLPEPIGAYLSRLGLAAIALGLIAVGAGLRLGGPSVDRAFAAHAVAVKLIAMPLAALLIARTMGLAPLPSQILVLFAAMPSASACYILAARMGGDAPYVARLITMTTLASAVAVPFWLSWVR
jgi:malonate transporter and related proteins